MFLAKCFGAIRGLALLLVVILTGGCPEVIGDPITESRIVNDTDSPVEVTLAMEKARYIIELSTPEETDDWLREFARGEGVEVTDVDVTQRVGRYRIKPGGFFVVHCEMGTEPYFSFDEMTITKGGDSLQLSNPTDIRARFQKGQGYRYEFKMSEAF